MKSKRVSFMRLRKEFGRERVHVFRYSLDTFNWWNKSQGGMETYSPGYFSLFFRFLSLGPTSVFSSGIDFEGGTWGNCPFVFCHKLGTIRAPLTRDPFKTKTIKGGSRWRKFDDWYGESRANKLELKTAECWKRLN